MMPSMFLSRSDLIQSSRSPWIAASSFFLCSSTAIVSSWEDACYEPQVRVVIGSRIQWMDGVETTRRVMRSYENDKQASPTSVHSHAQNDLILAIILRYVSVESHKVVPMVLSHEAVPHRHSTRANRRWSSEKN